MANNTKPSPMTHESRRLPNLSRQRTAAALKADDMSVEELKATAAELQIDTTGLKGKEALADAVKQAAKGS